MRYRIIYWKGLIFFWNYYNNQSFIKTDCRHISHNKLQSKCHTQTKIYFQLWLINGIILISSRMLIFLASKFRKIFIKDVNYTRHQYLKISISYILNIRLLHHQYVTSVINKLIKYCKLITVPQY